MEPGTRRSTTEWPIQKYLWSDFMVNPGDEVAYCVMPMIGPADALAEAKDQASPWSPTVAIGAETDGRTACFFNRGIVASQWLTRLLPQDHPSTKLAKVIASPGDKIRNFLAGAVRDKLVSLLTDAKAANGHIYAALFELDDPELIPLLQGLRKRAHIVLGNGSVKRKGEDENADARAALDMCDVKDRMTAPRALAHRDLRRRQGAASRLDREHQLGQDRPLHPGEQCAPGAQSFPGAVLSGSVEGACGGGRYNATRPIRIRRNAAYSAAQ